MRKKAFAEEDEIVIRSQKNINDSTKDNLCHLVAIAMNEYGLPVALFTLNHWVVKGLWYKADDIIRAMRDFSVNKPNYSLTSDWVSALVRLFEPQIAELLHRRDEIIADFQREHKDESVWTSKKLEVTSLCHLTPA